MTDKDEIINKIAETLPPGWELKITEKSPLSFTVTHTNEDCEAHNRSELLETVFSIRPGKRTAKFQDVTYSQDPQRIIAHSVDPKQIVGASVSSALVNPKLLIKCARYLATKDDTTLCIYTGGQHQPLQLVNPVSGESMIIATFTEGEKGETDKEKDDER